MVNIALTAFVVIRRARRSHYFALKDQARYQLSGTVRDACRGSRDAILALKAYRDAATRDAIEELLLASVTTKTHHAVTEVMVELGFVAQWSKRAFLGGYIRHTRLARVADAVRVSRVLAVRRAIAVGHLGCLHSSVAAPLMIEALQDPSPLVISVAADSLARTESPSALTPLLDLLRRASDHDTVAPERGAKAALVALRPDAAQLASAYSAAESKRFRMAILDVLHELHCATNINYRLSNPTLIDALRDSDCEIRARAVRLIPILEVESGSVAAALKDESALVRLRAIYVKSAADTELFANVHHQQWRVREAVVTTLSRDTGTRREQLVDKLLTTDDRYAAEQIMEQWQLSGELRSCIMRLNDEDQLVCRKAVDLGMDSMLIEALQPHTPEGSLIKLLEITKHSAHPSRASHLALLAECARERVGAIALTQLQCLEGTQAEAVGAA
jgi:HEAT repeat protein